MVDLYLIGSRFLRLIVVQKDLYSSQTFVRLWGLIEWRVLPQGKILSRFTRMKFHPPLNVIFSYFNVCDYMVFSSRLPGMKFHPAFQQAGWNFPPGAKLLYHACNCYFFRPGMKHDFSTRFLSFDVIRLNIFQNGRVKTKYCTFHVAKG